MWERSSRSPTRNRPRVGRLLWLGGRAAESRAAKTLAVATALVVLVACKAGLQATTTAPSTTTPTAAPPAEAETLVLQQVARAMGWETAGGAYERLELSAEGTAYRLACVVATGHSVDVRIQRFAGPDGAHDAFEAAREEHPVHDFHGYPAAAWQRDARPDNPGMPMRHRYHVWQAERWLVTVHSFDDTHFALAPAPLDVSAAVHQAALETGLFGRIDSSEHLPLGTTRLRTLADLW